MFWKLQTFYFLFLWLRLCYNEFWWPVHCSNGHRKSNVTHQLTGLAGRVWELSSCHGSRFQRILASWVQWEHLDVNNSTNNDHVYSTPLIVNSRYRLSLAPQSKHDYTSSCQYFQDKPCPSRETEGIANQMSCLRILLWKINDCNANHDHRPTRPTVSVIIHWSMNAGIVASFIANNREQDNRVDVANHRRGRRIWLDPFLQWWLWTFLQGDDFKTCSRLLEIRYRQNYHLIAEHDWLPIWVAFIFTDWVGCLNQIVSNTIPVHNPRPCGCGCPPIRTITKAVGPS